MSLRIADSIAHSNFWPNLDHDWVDLDHCDGVQTEE